jgi:hypothetical protein
MKYFVSMMLLLVMVGCSKDTSTTATTTITAVTEDADAPTTLLSSGTISPYKAQRNGLFMAADFLAAVPMNT